MTEDSAVFVTPTLLAGQELAARWVDHFSDVDGAVEAIGTALQTAQVRTIGEARQVLEALGVSEEQIQRNIRFALGL